MRIRINVDSRKGRFTFVGIIRRCEKSEDLRLDPDEFYRRFAERLPDFPHYEIEIDEPGREFFAKVRLHVHESLKYPIHFVCFPSQIATEENAVDTFRTWCLGTVATVVEEVDLNTALKDANNDRIRMAQMLQERFGIAVA